MSQEQEREAQLLLAATAAGITSPKELANFMAQVTVESTGLTKIEESFMYRNSKGKDGTEIEGSAAARIKGDVKSANREGDEVLETARKDALAGKPEQLAELMYGGRMGNNDPGDGYKYRGRGYIQLTGKDNYTAAGQALGLDLVQHPELTAAPENATRIAIWYWHTNVLEAEREDVRAATLKVNHGFNLLDRREASFTQWQQILTHEVMTDLAQGKVNLPAMPDQAHILHLGSHGPAVAELQSQLAQLGYTDNHGHPLPPDAHFGSATRNALESFQHDHGLKPDGVAGRVTLDKLGALAPHPDHAMHVPVGTRVGQMLAAAETGDWQRLRADTQEILAQARAEVNGLGHPQQHAQSPAAQHGGQAAQAPAQADTRPFDPRHPQHPEHAMYQSVRDQLVALHDAQGLKLTPEQLDNGTAAIMADAREAGMRTVDSLQFSVHRDSNRTTDISQVVSFQGDPKDLAGRATATNMSQAIDTPATQSYQQFDQSTQVMAQQDQQLQQQRLAEQQSQGMSMHR